MIGEPVGVLVEVSGQRIVGMRGFDGAGHPSLDPVEAGREAKRLLGGRRSRRASNSARAARRSNSETTFEPN